ncbi:MAG: MBL fold metallo-hydrolase [Desulfovibrionaceae bacterium]|nr:MBL fold metallo-hydrolase [Desulfovibrionaceae bacterium]
MYFKQIVTPGLGCFSYMIGCPRAKSVAVVDPKRDIRDYLDIARDEGMRITHVINTHVHADHISGDQELRAATGADIYVHVDSPVTYAHKPLHEGDVMEIGAARMEVLFTPGHTPQSISLVVTDLVRCAEPEMILTGDLLFVGDIGRPDLPGHQVLEGQVKNLYDSLYVKLAKYPDHMEVYPAHGQGSLCGRGMSAKQSSTLGYERRANPMLRFADFESFKKEVMSAFPVRPKSFSHIIAANMKGANLLDACPLERSLTPEQFEAEMQSGAVVIDVREAAAFGGMHIPGSLNIGFEKQLANWVGMVVDPDADILLVTPTRDDYERMTLELHRIGYDRVMGYLRDGVMGWLLSGRPVDRLDLIAPRELAGRLEKGDITVLDVRTPAEWASGHLAGAMPLPLTDIIEGRSPKTPQNAPLAILCTSGYRSNIAASLLIKQGFTSVSTLAGGIMAWGSADLPVTA